MMKRVLFFVVAAVALTCAAQTSGQWKSHPKYVSSGVQNLIDTKNTVFFQANNSMFSYDKATEKVNVFNKETGASDLVVSGSYYNYDANYLLIAYNNSNIDIVRADGGVVNLPDIKDVVYNGKKGINNVTFSNGKAFVATEFGLVIIDDKTMQITETYYYNTNIQSAAQVGDILVLAYDGEIFYDTRKYHDDLSKFATTYVTMEPNTRFFVINEDKFFVASDRELDICTINRENTETPATFTTISSGNAGNIQRTATGFIANFKANNFYYTFDHDGANATKYAGGAEFFSAHPLSDGTIWAMGDNGLHKRGDTSYIKPNGIGITENAFWSTYNPGDGLYYLSRTTDNALISKYSGVVTEIWTYDGNEWKNATPQGAPNNYGNYWLVFEPGKKNSYFYSTRGGGSSSAGYYGMIAHVVDGKVQTVYDGRTNAPLTFMNAIAMDKDGNLWGVQPYRPESEGPYVVALPNEKINKKDLTKADWVLPDLHCTTGNNKRSSITVSKGTDIKVFTTGAWSGPLMIWDNEGDIYNTKPKNVTYTRVNDTDGTSMQWQYIRCLVPDNDGNVWAGTTSGLFYFNPAEAFSDNFKVTRPKQSAKSAAFLLDGESIQCIAVDSLNRKWLGTATQGVFVLNAENTEVIAQYDVTNSSLPSSNIWNICAIPNRNSMMFVTDNGVAEYFNEPQLEEQTNVQSQAYPNPVLPNFTGYVTITGLVNNAVVKITDRKGNVVAQLQANGTVAHWDACDATTGERLATGVYNVYAGESEETLPTEPTTQIRVIK